MRNLIIAAVLAAAPLGGGWYVYDRAMDARYERRCVGSADDIDQCYTGYAAWARKRCDARQLPPGFPAAGPGSQLKHCVQAWLAHGK